MWGTVRNASLLCRLGSCPTLSLLPPPLIKHQDAPNQQKRKSKLNAHCKVIHALFPFFILLFFQKTRLSLFFNQLA